MRHDRIKFISHLGKQILLVDFSNRSAAEVAEICRAVPEIVTTLPRDSVLIMSDYTGASFDEEAMRVMKESAVFDKPFVRKSALVGTDSVAQKFFDGMSSFSRREFPVFKTREEALTWLVRE